MRTLLTSILLTSVALTSCSSEGYTYPEAFIDLNRTTSAPMSLSAVVSPDSSLQISLTPNNFGTYAFRTDTLASGIYLATWDSLHALPLLIHQGEQFRICGSWQLWDSLTTSSPETNLLWQAETLKHELFNARQAAATHFSSPDAPLDAKNKPLLSDSINALRAIFRPKADALLAQADTSLAALAILGIADLYDPMADYDLFTSVLNNLLPRHPNIPYLSKLNNELKTVRDFNTIKRRYARGNDRPNFLFLRNGTDSLSTKSYFFYKKPIAIALLTDSASLSRKMSSSLSDIAQRNGRILVQSNVPFALPDKLSPVKGSLAEIDCLTELNKMAPLVLTFNADGLVERLIVGKK